MAAGPGDALALFHPVVARWFAERYGEPTEVQRRAWPIVSAGRHVLLSAPTGTGKTYAAFLFALNSLIRGEWESGSTRVLYVSPLKALNNDVRVNLLNPLEELRSRFRESGEPMPRIEVLTRSGDTPQAERRRMVHRPPEILITTPESLNLILSSPRSREILAGVRTVILDEIHSLLAEKRGAHLMSAVERLVLLAGEFQRIGLSATVRPLVVAAEFLGGYSVRKEGGSFRYARRPVEVVESNESKRLELSVAYPEEALSRRLAQSADGGPPTAGDESYWEIVADELREIIARRSSTLVFVNSRQLAERMAHLINERTGRVLAYPHHGSLSRELRAVVEKRLKNGELQAIVATSSLELGIDIGELEEVILVQTPPGIAQAVQRVGRVGHSIGLTSRGRIIPSHGMDLLRALVASDLVGRKEIEESAPVRCPLDVLAQIVISMTAIAPWRLDDLYGALKASYTFHELTRRQFDLVIEMLEGHYADSRIRELSPRVSVDRSAGIVRAREGALFLLYSSGGTIPDRGYYGLHARGSNAKIGELDEEFVWERKVGDAFSLGSQRWKIVSIDHERVIVVPWQGAVNSNPFWRAEKLGRSYHFSEAITDYLERCERALRRAPGGAASDGGPASRGGAQGGDPAPAAAYARERDGQAAGAPAAGRGPVIPAPPGATPGAIAALEQFLCRQREATGAALPHRHHLLIERSRGKDGVAYLILHTLWGGRLNEPLALALSALLRRSYLSLDVTADNDVIVVTLPEELELEEGVGRINVKSLLAEITAENLEGLLVEELEASGFFGARFRENAGRALLLPKARHGKRVPLWVTRLKAKRLLDRVRRYADFPIVAETWRECIRDDFDLESLARLLGELRSGEITSTEVVTPAPSPFAAGAMWISTASYIYSDDASPAASGSSMSRELLAEMVFDSTLRVRIPEEVARRFEAKLKRTAPGWVPRSAHELADWVKERLLVPAPEWRELLEATAGGAADAEALEGEVAPRIARLGAGAVVSVDNRAWVERALRGDAAGALAPFLREWLQFYGPVGEESLRSLLAEIEPAVTAERFAEAVDELIAERTLVRDVLTSGAGGTQLCDAENLERLLGFLRRESAPVFSPLPIEKLPLFLAEWQGLIGARDEGLRESLEGLFGYPARAALWEEEILPARLPGYRCHWLDGLLRESDLEWFGCGKEQLAFRFRADRSLFPVRGSRGEGTPGENGGGFHLPPPGARYAYPDLRERSKLPAREFAEAVWKAVWRGELFCDSFDPIRRGAAAGFKIDRMEAARAGAAPLSFPMTGSRRGGRARWRPQAPLSGNWYSAETAAAGDLLEELEESKERVRILLDRYGVLFRELLAHELPELRWSRIFKAMRLMELAGEILSGVFFESIPGLQFASHAALSRLREELPEDAVYWMNAVDPASLSGVEPAQKRAWPSRLPSNRIVFHGSSMVLLSRRNCAELEIRVEPNHPRLPDYLSFLRVLAERDGDQPASIKVERINGEPVRLSPFRQALIDFGFREDFKAFSLWARTRGAAAV